MSVPCNANVAIPRRYLATALERKGTTYFVYKTLTCLTYDDLAALRKSALFSQCVSTYKDDRRMISMVTYTSVPQSLTPAESPNTNVLNIRCCIDHG